MNLRIRTAQALIVGGFSMIALGLGAGVADAAPPTPPPNPGGHYGPGYQDLVDDLGLTVNQSSYDENGNFKLEDMFGAVCNNPGYICT